MKMKSALLGLSVLWICGSAMAQERDPVGPAGEWAGYFNVAFPGAGDYDLFDTGYGVELQYRYWVDAPWGWAAALGVSTWDAKSSSSDLGVPNLHSFNGSATLIHLGGSGLYRILDTENVAVTLEAGVRYVIVDDDIDAKDANRGDARQNLDIDDGIVGLIAADADFRLNDGFVLAFGLGYQGDLVKGDISSRDDDLKDNELQAFFVRVGGKFEF